MNLLLKYATRSRPELFLRGLQSIYDNVTSDNYHILVSIDADDMTMNNFELVEKLKGKTNLTIIAGESKSKIDAINRDIEKFEYDWDMLINMSDDMIFNSKGFDDTIRGVFAIEEFTKEFNAFDRFIHFPDGNRSDLCTMSIIGKDYYNRDKYIYNPEYKSLFCDDEAQQVAKIRGCYKYVDTQIFEHLHPAYGKAVFDEQYQRTEAIGNTEDVETFKRRKENNFGL